MALCIYSPISDYKYNSIKYRQNKGNREMRNSKKNKGARVFGRPGSSANTNNALRQAYTNLSWRAKSAIFVVGSILGALSSLAIGINPLLGGALIAGVILFLSSLFLNKGTWATLIILSVYAFASIPLGGIMIAPISQAQLTYAVEAGVSLFTAALLVGWLSLRYGRIAPWKILALALTSSSLVGIVFGLLIPGSGINAARITMLVAVAYGAGVFDWVISGAQILKDKINKVDRHSENSPLVLSENQIRKILSKAEQATASSLSEYLNEEYAIFHDIVSKKSTSTIAHLVIGPSGVTILASVAPAGQIVETSGAGLEIPGVEIGAIASNLLAQRVNVADALKIRKDDIKLVVVAQDTRINIAGLSRTFAAFESLTAKTSNANIALVSDDMLAYEVGPSINTLNPATKNILIHRAQSVFMPSTKRLVASESLPVSVPTADGEVMNPVKKDIAEWLREGSAAKVSLKEKTINHVRIYIEPYRDEYGETVVGIVLDEEWSEYKKSGKKPEVFTFPASAVKPL
jgi:hypothetical protein